MIKKHSIFALIIGTGILCVLGTASAGTWNGPQSLIDSRGLPVHILTNAQVKNSYLSVDIFAAMQKSLLSQQGFLNGIVLGSQDVNTSTTPATPIPGRFTLRIGGMDSSSVPIFRKVSALIGGTFHLDDTITEGSVSNPANDGTTSKLCATVNGTIVLCNGSSGSPICTNLPNGPYYQVPFGYTLNPDNTCTGPVVPTLLVCIIDSFTPNPTTVVPTGGQVVLSWQTTNCDNVTINGIAQASVDGAAQTNAMPNDLFTLVATNANSTDTATVTIGLNDTPGACSYKLSSEHASHYREKFSLTHNGVAFNAPTNLAVSFNTTPAGIVANPNTVTLSQGTDTVFKTIFTTQTFQRYTTQTLSVTPGAINGETICTNNIEPSYSGPIYAGDNSTCFLADTMVTLADGSKKNIQDIKIGDVLKGETTNNTVLGFHRPSLQGKVYGFNRGRAFVTEEHPFMTTKGWKALNPQKTAREHNLNITIGTLAVGDTLVTDRGLVELRLIESKIMPATTPLYNFKLTGDHTYYADGYLVHNKVSCDANNPCLNGNGSPSGAICVDTSTHQPATTTGTCSLTCPYPDGTVVYLSSADVSTRCPAGDYSQVVCRAGLSLCE